MRLALNVMFENSTDAESIALKRATLRYKQGNKHCYTFTYTSKSQLNIAKRRFQDVDCEIDYVNFEEAQEVE